MKINLTFILLFAIGKLHAQTTAQKIEATGKKIENTIGKLDALNGLFKKKNPASDAKQTTDKSTADNPFTAKIAANAKYIDASQVYPFINGKAIVKKGEAFGVIDTSGNFIVPYNKYPVIAYAGKYMLQASGMNKSIILNNKGSILADFGALYQKGNYTTISGDYIFIRPNNARTFTLIDGDGKSHTITEDKLPNGKYMKFHKMSGQTVIMQEVDSRKFGFKGLNNKLLADCTFQQLSPFKDGYAAFMQYDNYQLGKFGVVDITGKKTIAPIFSKPPLNLGDGYFRVNAADDADFYFAILNSKGEILHKEMKSKGYIHSFDYYEDGYFYSEKSQCIMNTEGKIIPQKDFLLKAGLSPALATFARFIKFPEQDFLTFPNTDISAHDGSLVFIYTQADRTNALGLLNTKTNRITLGIFPQSNLGYDYIFDPASKMALVSQDSQIKDKNKGYGTIENIGFMSADGKIKIIQAEKKSGW